MALRLRGAERKAVAVADARGRAEAIARSEQSGRRGVSSHPTTAPRSFRNLDEPEWKQDRLVSRSRPERAVRFSASVNALHLNDFEDKALIPVVRRMNVERDAAAAVRFDSCIE